MLYNKTGFDPTLNRKCDILGDAFELSVRQYGYDSHDFVKKVMTDRKLDWLFKIDDCQEWCDGHYLMSILDYYEDFKKGVCESANDMWWIGYLYKYWMLTRGTSRREIYKILPLKRFVATSLFYCSQDWEYVVNDAIRVYETKSYEI